MGFTIQNVFEALAKSEIKVQGAGLKLDLDKLGEIAYLSWHEEDDVYLKWSALTPEMKEPWIKIAKKITESINALWELYWICEKQC